MSWLVHLNYLPDKPTVNTDDLTLAEWDPVRAASDAPWWQVMAAPVLFPAGAAALVEACADHAGRPKPADGWLTPKNVLDVFESVAEDLPTGYDGQGVPDPKAEDAATTTSSSGPSNGSGGRRRSSAPSPSVTSTS